MATSNKNESDRKHADEQNIGKTAAVIPLRPRATPRKPRAPQPPRGPGDPGPDPGPSAA